jgi:hypothetical protein
MLVEIKRHGTYGYFPGDLDFFVSICNPVDFWTCDSDKCCHCRLAPEINGVVQLIQSSQEYCEDFFWGGGVYIK